MPKPNDKRMEAKDWDDMNTGEKLEALGCDSPEDAIELCSDLLDTFNQAEDMLKKNDPPMSEAQLRKELLSLLQEGETSEN